MSLQTKERNNVILNIMAATYLKNMTDAAKGCKGLNEKQLEENFTFLLLNLVFKS